MRSPRSPKGRAREVARRLAQEYPGTAPELCELDHGNPFQLLAATILSAQSTDQTVNRVTPELFKRWPTPDALATADVADVEQVVGPTGFFRNKTKSLIGMAQALVERHGGEVPHRMEDLVQLPGVGRKTANVVRSVALDEPGFPADTHVLRLTKRLGITEHKDPVKVEMDVNAMVPAAELGALSLRLILHGRRVCTARKPRCDACILHDICPSAFRVP